MKTIAARLAALVSLSVFIAILNVHGYGQAAAGQEQKPPKPEIVITVIPPSGPGGPSPTAPIAGTAKGVDFRAHRVVIYAFADNSLWYVQPTEKSPKTPIGGDGNWDVRNTHLGRQYAAALVIASFKPQASSAELPELGGDVLAIDVVAGSKPGGKR